MKKIFILVLCGILIFCAGCRNKTDSVENKINIVVSAFPQYDFVREIAKDKAGVTLLLPPGSEAHSYEPSPGDIINIKEADLFIAIGGESEHWVLHLLEGEELKNTPTLKLMDFVTGYAEEHTEGMDQTHNSHSHIHTQECEHHGEEEFDEHIWTSPQNAIIMCKTICDSLCEIDPENKEFYLGNLSSYTNKLEKLCNEYKTVRENAKRDTLIFGDRFPLRYLTEYLNLKYYAAFPGCSSKTEPSAKTVVFLTEKVKEKNIPVIFYMDYSDGRIAKTVAEECKIKAMRLYSCHNLSGNDLKSGESYISLMKKNLNAIKEALG